MPSSVSVEVLGIGAWTTSSGVLQFCPDRTRTNKRGTAKCTYSVSHLPCAPVLPAALWACVLGLLSAVLSSHPEGLRFRIAQHRAAGGELPGRFA